MTAVTYGLQDTDEDIVHNEGKGTEEINPEVDRGFGEYVCRCSHPYEDARGQNGSRYGQQDTGRDTERNRGMYRILHFLHFFCSVISGDHDSGAHGNPVKKSNHKKNQVAGRADSRKGVAAKKIADDQGIGSIV